MIYTDSGINRVVATKLRPINSYVLVLKLIDPEYFQGSSLLKPDSFKSDEYGFGIVLSDCGLIEIGNIVVYGRYNTTDGLDELIYLPKVLSDKLAAMINETAISNVASYNTKRCSFAFIHYHGIMSKVVDNKLVPIA